MYAAIALFALISPGFQVERVVLDADFPGAYQVEVADVNGDGKLDVVVVGGSTCAWYENPTWKKRIVTGKDRTPDIISSATADFDGDGKADIAIGFDFAMNEPNRGKLLMASPGEAPDDAWTTRAFGNVPSIHRLRAGDLNGDGKRDELIVAAIFGPESKPPLFTQDQAGVFVLIDRVHTLDAVWRQEKAGKQPVLHAIRVVDLDGDGLDDILAAGNEGVVWMKRAKDGAWSRRVLTPGAEGEAPKRGCSEIHVGKLADGRKFLATIDPWHGSQVAIVTESKPGSLEFGDRRVIDDTLDDGHALYVADIDGDGTDEVFAGHRGKGHRVSAYHLENGGWKRFVIDEAIAAQDLRGGDLDGDGRPEIVAVGGSTKNVVLYRFAKFRPE
ncbi:MAG: VCBS repeat-containing protein [Isosphaeraceae bacterium]